MLSLFDKLWTDIITFVLLTITHRMVESPSFIELPGLQYFEMFSLIYDLNALIIFCDDLVIYGLYALLIFVLFLLMYDKSSVNIL